MNAIHAVWSEVRVPQLNRLLKNFGVRLIQTRTKKWGDKSTITGSYLEGGLPFAAKAAIAQQRAEYNKEVDRLLAPEMRHEELLDVVGRVIKAYGLLNAVNGPEFDAMEKLYYEFRPKLEMDQFPAGSESLLPQ